MFMLGKKDIPAKVRTNGLKDLGFVKTLIADLKVEGA
jgi:hypothetical protein